MVASDCIIGYHKEGVNPNPRSNGAQDVRSKSMRNHHPGGRQEECLNCPARAVDTISAPAHPNPREERYW